jgi:hypothetical protein
MEGARKRRPRGVASTNYLSWGYGRAFRSLCGKFSRPSEAFELTFNATLSTLVSTQRLRVWRPLNSTRMVRYLFLTTILDAWIGGLSRVPGRPGQRRSKLTEFEQVAGLFDRYSGGESSSRMCLSGMTPPFGRMTRNGVAALRVWEARLSASRVFCWCVEPGVLVAVEGDRADALKRRDIHSPGSYEAHARSADRWRRAAGFTNADIWVGGDLDAFLTPPEHPPI